MQSYEDNCSKLSKLLTKHHYFLIRHRSLTENAWKTIMQANDALEKAGKLVEKYKSRTIVRILKDGLGITLRSELKKYEKLKREMEENNSKVESLLQQINEIIESQPELVGGQVTFDTPDMEETTFWECSESSGSGSPSQLSIEDAEREVQTYKSNYWKLNWLIREHDSLLAKHFDLTENIHNTIGQTFQTLRRAEGFVYEHKEKTTTRLWKVLSSPQYRRDYEHWRVYEQLRRVMEENNSKVQCHFREIEDVISSQQPASTDQVDREIPFTEPYDEGVCEFPTLDSRA
ncbi:hypothetical protein CDV31_007999 [Fusarium ambrosium]|uniref:Uncharacterized protein n=1 Tax=Fusarium ambrosium TaxID=131363 RepID=A0A428U3G1_9HYPO|nr:hypothetical protein CDV31_007999 [Fusarium ambrosium]